MVLSETTARNAKYYYFSRLKFFTNFKNEKNNQIY